MNRRSRRAMLGIVNAVKELTDLLRASRHELTIPVDARLTHVAYTSAYHPMVERPEPGEGFVDTVEYE